MCNSPIVYDQKFSRVQRHNQLVYLMSSNCVHLLIGRLYFCGNIPDTAIIAAPPNLEPARVLPGAIYASSASKNYSI